MNCCLRPCELAATITAVSCAIAECVPLEDIPIIASILFEIGSTLGTIAEQERRCAPKNQTPTTFPNNNIIL